MADETTAAPATDTAAPVLTATNALLADAAPAEKPADAPSEAPADDKPADDQPAALAMPGKDATPEEWQAFYAALGKPETPDQYEMEIPDGDDGAFAKQVAPLLHKANVTAEQAKVLSQGWNQMKIEAEAAIARQQAEEIAALDAQNKAEAAALQKEWGQQHEANMHFAKLATQQFLPGEKAADVISAIESVVGYKQTIQMLHAIGKGLAEHDAAGLGGNNGGGATKSAAEVLYGNNG